MVYVFVYGLYSMSCMSHSYCMFCMACRSVIPTASYFSSLPLHMTLTWLKHVLCANRKV